MRRILLIAFVIWLDIIALGGKGAAVLQEPSLPPKPIPLTVKSLPASALQPVSEVQAVYVPPPTVVAAVAVTPVAQTGCVTNYSTGDYYLDKIINYESSGNSCATNPGGCFGLLQACPGAPLRSACGGNPSCQIAWFQDNKTGGRSWATVWQHELDFGWW